ncbi:MAG: hypothetical protein KAI64_06785 [Thermoplasmata archaeon]|nr:hypothetical protein [Thermoplasmata archaeon]
MAKKEKLCSIEGCRSPSARSISMKSAKKAFSGFKEDSRRAYLCKEHYKKYRKSTKKDRKLERLDW